jgi:hypothetical protein
LGAINEFEEAAAPGEVWLSPFVGEGVRGSKVPRRGRYGKERERGFVRNLHYFFLKRRKSTK